MKYLLLCIVVALFISSPLLLSCTKSEDVETDQGAIESMTEEAGEEMAERILGPLGKANDTKELIDENYRDMEENLKNQ